MLAACSTVPTTVRPQARPIADDSLPPTIKPELTPRERIVDIALQEWLRWGGQVVDVTQGQACVTESNLPLPPEYMAARAAADAGLTTQVPCLRYPDGSGMEATADGCALAVRYWHLLGRDPDCVQITGARWAWSAAFISWVLRQAGLGEDQFLTGQAHSMYVADARDGILPDPAYRVEAFPAMPVAGDMICSARDAAVPVSNPQQILFGRTPMHCDIVIATDAASRTVRAIGGNVQQAVSMSVISWTDAPPTPAAPIHLIAANPGATDMADAPPDEAPPLLQQPWLLVMRYQLKQ
ncbi:DUF2272 domain-containing protein [Uliginosibacterium sp. H1]|uniref:DUF2272 domain-containing protein n=1 Tax=Uliginosibacterium sp. H1 TaxID=3114757 RepID=UPI002E188A32|nr:DUF2272 domain-containing protein [Uliginosibacterium sp. H1]